MRKNKVGANYTESAPAKRELQDPVTCKYCETEVERHSTMECIDKIDRVTFYQCLHQRRCEANLRERTLGNIGG